VGRFTKAAAEWPVQNRFFALAPAKQALLLIPVRFSSGGYRNRRSSAQYQTVFAIALQAIIVD